MSQASSPSEREATSLRPWPWLLAASLLVHGASATPGILAEDTDADRELEVLEEAWLDSPAKGWSALWQRPRKLVVARQPGQPSDVYQAFVELSPEGKPIGRTAFFNLSRTPEAAEHTLRIHELRAAWLVSSAGRVTAAEVAAFEPPRSLADRLRCWIAEGRGCSARPVHDSNEWTRLQRWQMRLENWHELGSPHVVRRARVQLVDPAARATLRLDEDGLHLRAHGEHFGATTGWNPTTTSPTFRWQVDTPGRPGNLTTWLAERLRQSRLGENGVALLKAVGFAGWDYARRATSALGGQEPAVDIAQDLGAGLRQQGEPSAFAGPAGWPPAPLSPLLHPPLRDEGQWLSLDEDPFVARGPDGVAPFTFTFLRPDAQRPYVQAYVLLWDPRRLELHAVAGTDDPKSSTGQRGSGRIPRDPRVLGRLAGAFNGAFRTRHGAFGMAADGVLYLPPKPYAATVARLADGSTGLGTWPDQPGLQHSVTSFRQNLTPLLQDGIDNPYRRHWWGGTPEGWLHESFTVRTALCLTRERFLAYVYGDALDPESLIRVVRALRCDYAMHLDMNAGHTGFELYRTAPVGSSTPLPQPLESTWQARGTVRGAEDFEFAARRLTRRMPLMNFPRYIHREQRDFFYLTLRPAVGQLPLPPSWHPSGPVQGWHFGPSGPGGAPACWGHASLRPFEEAPEIGAHVLTLDPGRLIVMPPGSVLTVHSSIRLVGSSSSATESSQSKAEARRFGMVESAMHAASDSGVWWHDGRFFLAERAPDRTWTRLAWLHPAERRPAVALVGLDRDGLLLYLDLEHGHAVEAERMLTVARRLELRAALPLARRLHWRWTSPNLAGDAAVSPAIHRVELVAVEGPGARRIFPETPVVPPQIWAYRQLRSLPLEAPTAAEPP